MSDSRQTEPRRVLHVWHGYASGTAVWLYRLLKECRRGGAFIATEPNRDGSYICPGRPWPEQQIVRQALPARRIVEQARAVLQGGPLKPRRARLLQAVRSHDIDLLHMHFGWTASERQYGGLPRPTLISLYGSDIFRRRPRYLRRLRRRLLEAPAVVTTSDAIRREALRLVPEHDNVTVIPVGIDLDDFPAHEAVCEARRSREDATLRLVSVGNFIECKAQDELPGIASELAKTGVDFTWTVVGDGPMRSSVAAEVAARHLTGQMTLTGTVPFERVRKELEEADIFVHNARVASDGTREALGVALMEAGAMGLPVVSRRVGGIPEVVQDSETGILVDEGNSDAFTNAIAELAASRDSRQRMGTNASLWVRRHFDSRELATKLEDLYASIPSRNR